LRWRCIGSGSFGWLGWLGYSCHFGWRGSGCAHVCAGRRVGAVGFVSARFALRLFNAGSGIRFNLRFGAALWLGGSAIDGGSGYGIRSLSWLHYFLFLG
jgi:hypothetical protein